MSVRPLSEALAEVARVELNETPSRLNESLCLLKEWIRKQKHLKARTDDQWLLAFLRGSKFSLERAKTKLDLYYSLRSTAPDMFCVKHTDPRVMDILDTGVALALPKTSSAKAPRVALIRPGCYDPDKYNVMEIMAVGALQQQICFMEDDNLTVSGVINVLDLQGTKLSHFTQLTPLHMKKLMIINQDASPVRLKAIHFLNTPPFFKTFFDIAKTLLNEKNKQRLHVHNQNYEAFYKHVPKDVLPIEYGGIDYSIQENINYWKNKFQQYHAWFEEDLNYGTVECKRSDESKSTAIIFGAQGSFRRLELD